MMLQDPDAVIRNETVVWNLEEGNHGKAERRMIRPYSWWNTYERRELEPPPIGLPEAEQDPDAVSQRQAAEEFVDFLTTNTGRIFQDELGRRYVLSINAEGDEIWALDENDDVLDVGLLQFVELQEHYQAWLEDLPEGLQGTPVAERLEAIADLDFETLRDIVPPSGYGRD